MRVESAQLSGKDYHGDTARKMYETVADRGWDGMSFDFHCGPRGERYTAELRVAGVSAGVRLSFADRFELLNFIMAAKWETTCPEDDATTAYRALALLASLHADEPEEQEQP